MSHDEWKNLAKKVYELDDNNLKSMEKNQFSQAMNFFIDKMFQEFDFDKNGLISFDEFRIFVLINSIDKETNETKKIIFEWVKSSSLFCAEFSVNK